MDREQFRVLCHETEGDDGEARISGIAVLGGLDPEQYRYSE